MEIFQNFFNDRHALRGRQRQLWSSGNGRISIATGNANGQQSMHLVVMRILGSVFRVEGTPWDYQNHLQPLAQGVEGFATCEVVLADSDGLITKTPQSAELHFHRIVQLYDAVEEIDLYDGPNLILKFRPITLADL